MPDLVRVVSLNVWGGRMEIPLLDWLGNTQADVFCLQEVFSGPTLADKALHDGDEKAVNGDLFGTLQSALPHHRGWFSAGSRGYLNDSTWLDLPFDYGIALFVGPSWSVTAQHSEMVHGEFRRDGCGSPPLSRTAQVIRCVGPQGSFTLGHLHGLWHPDGKHDSEIRLKQAHCFAALLDGLAQPGDALIVCGDFNLLPNAETFDVLERLGLKNLIRIHKIHCTRSTLYQKSVRNADYVLVDDRVQVLNLEVVRDPVVSDHCPLVLEAELAE